MASYLDNCRFTPTLGGTTDWVYSAAVPGCQSPTAANAVNGTVYRYRAESQDLTQWEIGYGAYNSGTGTFPRTTILFNSSGTTAAINFNTVPQVAVVALAEDLPSLSAATNTFTGALASASVAATGAVSGATVAATGSILSTGTTGVGYATGAGGTVTQITSRTTGVTLSKISGAITLLAGAPVVGTWVSFIVTNTLVAATDTIIVSVKSGTNTYIAFVSAVAAGSFQISFDSILGTASDSPVINFAVIKAVNV